jgi:hypothetical protein
MLSTVEPAEFWKSIGAIAGWRLMSCNGSHDAIFTTPSLMTVLITQPMAELLDSLVCSLGDHTSNTEHLLELATAIVSEKPKSLQKKRELYKEFRVALRRVRHQVQLLRSELPHLFAHSDANAEYEEDDNFA